MAKIYIKVSYIATINKIIKFTARIYIIVIKIKPKSDKKSSSLLTDSVTIKLFYPNQTRNNFQKKIEQNQNMTIF